MSSSANRTCAAVTILLLLVAAPAVAEESVTERNERMARQFMDEVYNQRQLDKIPEYVAEAFVDSSPGAPESPQGREMVRLQAEATFAAFPDLVFEPLRLISEGDLVAIHWTSHGTASDQIAGPVAAGTEVELQGISIFRYDAKGRVVESWDIVDRAGLYRQLGFRILPPTGPDEEPAAEE